MYIGVNTPIILMHWVGQNVHLGFSIRWYGKPELTFWPTQDSEDRITESIKKTVKLRTKPLCTTHRWFRGKESGRQCRWHRRHEFDPWVRKISWRRQWQPTSVFLPGKSHGQRSLAGYSPWGSQRVKHDWVTEHTPCRNWVYDSL